MSMITALCKAVSICHDGGIFEALFSGCVAHLWVQWDEFGQKYTAAIEYEDNLGHVFIIGMASSTTNPLLAVEQACAEIPEEYRADCDPILQDLTLALGRNPFVFS